MEIRREQANHEMHTPRKKTNWLKLAVSPVYLITTGISLLINIPVMNTIWRERRELEQLTEEHMRDIGIDPQHVLQECKKSFFDIPDDRRKSILVIGLGGYRREF